MHVIPSAHIVSFPKIILNADTVIDIADFILHSKNNNLSSGDFDYLFVSGHYMILDIFGWYDFALKDKLLPLLKKYNVQDLDKQ